MIRDNCLELCSFIDTDFIIHKFPDKSLTQIYSKFNSLFHAQYLFMCFIDSPIQNLSRY